MRKFILHPISLFVTTLACATGMLVIAGMTSSAQGVELGWGIVASVAPAVP